MTEFSLFFGAVGIILVLIAIHWQIRRIADVHEVMLEREIDCDLAAEDDSPPWARPWETPDDR